MAKTKVKSTKKAKKVIKVKMPTLAELNIVMRDRNAPDYKFQSTSLSGYIFTDYKNIVKLFGKPNSVGDAYKIDAHWEFEMNGKVMTIYNYKDGKNYMGRHGLATSKIKEWHVGSADNVMEEIKTLSKVLLADKFQMM